VIVATIPEPLRHRCSPDHSDHPQGKILEAARPQPPRARLAARAAAARAILLEYN
jgi:hypothetical protein